MTHPTDHVLDLTGTIYWPSSKSQHWEAVNWIWLYRKKCYGTCHWFSSKSDSCLEFAIYVCKYLTYLLSAWFGKEHHQFAPNHSSTMLPSAHGPDGTPPWMTNRVVAGACWWWLVMRQWCQFVYFWVDPRPTQCRVRPSQWCCRPIQWIFFTFAHVSYCLRYCHLKVMLLLM